MPYRGLGVVVMVLGVLLCYWLWGQTAQGVLEIIGVTVTLVFLLAAGGILGALGTIVEQQRILIEQLKKVTDHLVPEDEQPEAED